MENSNPISYRRLAADDVAEFRRLRLLGLRTAPTAFSSDYATSARMSIEEFRDRFPTQVDNFVIGAFAGERLIGNGGLYRETGIKVAHRASIWGVFVDPTQRRRGIAQRICSDLLHAARRLEGITQVHLAVESGNVPARTLYERLGFTCYGTEPNAIRVDDRFYDDDLMILHVSGTRPGRGEERR